ncbi:MAG: PBP1A family penicillin-binding protein [Salibaculum sp.]|uniref:penicillin-binding protein 1A n=1 Tax=Salibaculum sp. TaxID=2855480 RepID=UPI00286FE234|nr:PBP1A family penicillin-binding protein [Salibaculum sp.]MDR9428047.1 PBP1A family penicillin-binding protein [Salibaculum sp.]MDR9482272.1 PBP1A family penicillin-binding protein [Salibaculum sp.]
MILRFILSFFGSIFSLLTLGAGMAALTLGAIFYMYGKDLPTHEALASYQPKTASRIYSAEGQIIDEFATEKRLFTPIEEIPDVVKDAFVSAEDKDFYSHDGYSVTAILSAVRDMVVTRGETVRGGSTITQQVAKNLLLDGSRTIERKVKEIILAPRLEQTLGKDGVLEIYLNEIFLGQNSFGVTAAARTYFNKSLSELTPGEAAYMASVTRRPSDMHPVRDRDVAVFRRNNTLREMFENGYIDRATYDDERDAPLLSVQNGDFPSYAQAAAERDYFTDEIRRQLDRDMVGEDFSSAGLAVRATIEPDMQSAAREALRKALWDFDRGKGSWRGTGVSVPVETLSDEAAWRAALDEADVARGISYEGAWRPAVVLDVQDQQLVVGIEDVPLDDARGNTVPRSDTAWFSGDLYENFDRGDVLHLAAVEEDGAFQRWSLRQVPEVQGGFMAMDVNSGRVLAMQGGFAFEDSELNRATQANRQPGSAFKPFVYAAALDSGWTPATIVVDAPIEVRAGGEIWRPMNASNRFYGPTPLRTGIERSRNIMTVRLAQEIGMEVIADYAEDFGVYDQMAPNLSAALGADETTLFKLVSAYAMFANGGERVQPTLIDRVQDRFGETIYSHDQAEGNKRVCVNCDDAALPEGLAPRVVNDRDRVMNAVTAYQLTSMMRGVVERGTASGAVNLPVPVAGKTGTTNDAKDVWFVGFSSNIVAGCYIGYDTPRNLGGGASGGALCAPVFQRFMEQAVERYGGGPFEVPETCRFISIDRFSGARLPDEARGPNVVRECFRAGEEPVFGLTYDGGYEMAGDLPLVDEVREARGVQVRTNSGDSATVNDNASFGTLSSGGLY